MLRFVRISEYYGEVRRSVRYSASWPSLRPDTPLDSPQNQPQLTYELAALALFDAYRADPSSNKDQFLRLVLGEVERVARLLHDWDDEHQRALRSSFWRGAHAYIVNNINTVDRGAELDDLAKLLGVDRENTDQQ